ncbi:MAG: abortive infection protein [Ignavibacteria bacterium RBG_13_36_8]|nr:MAG: abortive infection protein [Ignavibacteria bacterium RBG_13_36_8]
MNENNNHLNFSEPQDDNHELKPRLSPTMSPLSAAFFGLVAVFILYQIVGSIITLAIFGLDIANADINAIRLLTMGGQILFILFPSLLFAKLIYQDVSTIIRYKYPSLREIGIFVIGLIILTPLLQEFLYLQNYVIEKLAVASPFIKQIKDFLTEIDKLVEQTYGNLLAADSVFESSFVILVVAVVPAVCEEIFFRGYVQKSFELKLKPFWAIFITALFFGLYHFSPFGLIPLITLGLFLGFAAYMSNSIFIPMILHFLNNFIAVIAYFVFGSEEIMNTTVIDMEHAGEHTLNFILLTIVFLALIYFIKNYYHLFTKAKGVQNDMS